MLNSCRGQVSAWWKESLTLGETFNAYISIDCYIEIAVKVAIEIAWQETWPHHEFSGAKRMGSAGRENPSLRDTVGRRTPPGVLTGSIGSPTPVSNVYTVDEVHLAVEVPMG